MISKRGSPLPLTYQFRIPWNFILFNNIERLSSNKKIKNFLIRIERSESGETDLIGYITSRKRVLKSTFCTWLFCQPNQLTPLNVQQTFFNQFMGETRWIVVVLNRVKIYSKYDNLGNIDLEQALNIHAPQAQEEIDYQEEERMTITRLVNEQNTRLLNVNKPKNVPPNENIPHVIINGCEFAGRLPVDGLLAKLCEDQYVVVPREYWIEDYFYGPMSAEFDWVGYSHRRNLNVEFLRKYVIALYISIYQKDDVNDWVKYTMQSADDVFAKDQVTLE